MTSLEILSEKFKFFVQHVKNFDAQTSTKFLEKILEKNVSFHLLDPYERVRNAKDVGFEGKWFIEP